MSSVGPLEDEAAGTGLGGSPADPATLTEIDPSAIQVRKTRTVVKLDCERLVSKKGLPYLLKNAPKHARISKRRDTYGNLCHVLQFYQLWAHELYPKAKFKDFVALCDRLGKTDRQLRAYRMQLIREELGLAAEGLDPPPQPLREHTGAGGSQPAGSVAQDTNTNADLSDDDLLYTTSRAAAASSTANPVPRSETPAALAGVDEAELLAQLAEMQRAAEEDVHESEDDEQLALMREMDEFM
ncbi:FABR100Wp [Eremothecium gossypii FDAG1]|nr:FABR100Wp [Eremothecium gossypii FDAG1]